jgi:hypothetical protein
MKKILNLLCLSLFFLNCVNPENKQSSDSKQSDSKNDSDSLAGNENKQKAEIQILEIDVNKLPKGIKYNGKIKSALRWIDQEGDNIVITTETGQYKNPKVKHERDGYDSELFGHHYKVSNDQAVKSWTVHDYIYDCILELDVLFIKNTLQVTDLNKNGLGEVWLMYKKVCHGDMGSYEMKIILYEGKNKYAMRGENKVEVEPGKYYGGDYQFDKAFNEGPEEFRDFAKKLWEKNIMQTYGEQ